MDIVRKTETVYLNKTETAILIKAKKIFEEIVSTAETYDLKNAAQTAVDNIDTFFNEEDEFEVCGRTDIIQQDKVIIEITI